MANFDRSGMTQAGINLMGKAVGGATIQFTKLVLGDGTMTGEILDLQGVVSPKQNVDVTRIERNDNQCTVGGELLTSSVKQGFFWRECGLYAMDPDVGEILYNYAYSTKPDYIAASDSGMMEEILVSMIATVGSNANVDITIDDSMVFATKKVVDKKPYYYSCITDMKTDTSLKEGDMAITLGYYQPEDGGAGEYVIMSSDVVDDGGSIHVLSNGLKAKLTVKNSVIDVRQFGVTSDGLNDETTKINKCISYLSSIGGGTVKFAPNARYKIKAHDQEKPERLINTGGINLKDNITLDLNNSTLEAIKNNCEGYNIISVTNVKNCKIRDGKLIGDLETHTGTTGEWGYGISLNGAENIMIENIESEKCWGDGINLQVLEIDGERIPCKNISINNVLCNNNRRQGMSIESVIKCTVKDSVFSNTGKIKGTSPMAGIDIEPYSTQNPCKDIFIINCMFEANGNTGLTCMGENVDNVTISECTFNNNVSKEGQVFIDKSQNIKVSNCTFWGYKKSLVWILNHSAYIENNRFSGIILLYHEGVTDVVSIKNNTFIFDGSFSGNAAIESVVRNAGKTDSVIIDGNYIDGKNFDLLYGIKTVLFPHLIENNTIKHVSRGVVTEVDTLVRKNKFTGCKVAAIAQQSGKLYVDSNIFDGCCNRNNGEGLIFNSIKRDLIMTNNTAYKSPLFESDNIEGATGVFGRFASYSDGIILDVNNNIVNNNL